MFACLGLTFNQQKQALALVALLEDVLIFFILNQIYFLDKCLQLVSLEDIEAFHVPEVDGLLHNQPVVFLQQTLSEKPRSDPQ
jgi:hypothetical protein